MLEFARLEGLKVRRGATIIRSLKIAGIEVNERDVIELAVRLRHAGMNEVGDTLENALIRGYAIAPLQTSDHEGILRLLQADPVRHGDLVAALFEQVNQATTGHEPPGHASSTTVA